MMKPRPYQTEGVGEIYERWAGGCQNVLYQLPTGGGKSIIFRMITDKEYTEGSRVLILAHRDNLISQASEHLQNAGVYHGLVSPKYPMVPCNVLVASVQTVVRRLSKIISPDLIVIDEAHHAKASTYTRIIDSFPEARVLGVTATPERADGQGLGDLFGSMVQGPDMRWLIAEGFLSPYRYYAPDDAPSFEDINDDDELARVVNKPKITGSAVDHWFRLAGGMPTLAACININHAESVARQFQKADVSSCALHSGLDDFQIEERIRGLKTGKYRVLSFCDMIGEGFDVPGVGALIKLRPTGSLTIDMQHNGRALRADYGPGEWPQTREERLRRMAVGPKPYAVFLDHVGNWQRHGMPDDARAWSLAGKVKRPVDKSTLKRCPACFRMAPLGARLCPYCNEEFPVNESRGLPEHVDGELVEIGDSRTLYDAIRDHGWSVVQARGIAATLGHRPELGERVFFEVFRRDKNMVDITP